MMSFLLEKLLWKGSCSHSQAQVFGSICFTLYFLKAFTPQNQKKEWLYFSMFYVSFIFWQVFLQTSHAEGFSTTTHIRTQITLSRQKLEMIACRRSNCVTSKALKDANNSHSSKVFSSGSFANFKLQLCVARFWQLANKQRESGQRFYPQKRRKNLGSRQISTMMISRSCKKRWI